MGPGSATPLLDAAERTCGQIGYSLRKKQAEVVSFVHGRGMFVSLPTKSGKVCARTSVSAVQERHVTVSYTANYI